METKNYIVLALRQGDENGHQYLIGWENNLKRAKQMADDEYEYRGCKKYSGVVYEVPKGNLLKGQEDRRKEVYRKGM